MANHHLLTRKKKFFFEAIMKYSKKHKLIWTLNIYAVNGVICPDVVVFDSPDNPHRIAPKIWHLIPSSMLEFLFAIVGTHRLIRSRSSYMFAQGSVKVGRIAKTSSDITCCHLDSFAHPLLNTIYRHQRQALQGLMELINEEDSRFSDSTLGLIAAFMLSNVSLFSLSSGFVAFLGSMEK